MAKHSPDQQYEQILTAVRLYPNGASIDEIESHIAPAPHRRTVQRWLGELISQQRLNKIGQGRATRYQAPRAPTGSEQFVAPQPIATHAEIHIPLSIESKEIEAYVRSPLQQRTPVGYRQEFLDSYRPNVSFYLPEATRAALLSHGQTVKNHAPAGTYARQIAHRLLIDLSWNSSRLEGNTYSLLETERLLSIGEAAPGKDAIEAQMILNHKDAIEFLIESADDIGFNRYTLLNLHALLADNLLEDPTATGRLRRIPVGIGQTVFLPLEGPQRIDECFQQVLDTAAAITDPFEQAFFAMVHLPYLQPFEDVNKRVSRLAANIPLIQRNLCPLAFTDVAPQTYISAMLGVYELNQVDLLRDVFVWAYKRSCARYSAVQQSLGEPDAFRVQHRALIADTVTEVVQRGMDKSSAIAWVRQSAEQHLPEADHARFIEITETQLMNLHEGNIARYRLRPSVFFAWQQRWHEQ